MKRIVLAFLALAGFAPATSLAAQEVSPCELHVWPSSRFNAVDKDNNVSLMSGLTVTSTFTVDDDVSQSLAAALSAPAQAEVMSTFPFGQTEQLAGYEVIVHADEVTPLEYAYIHDDGVGEGARLTDSTSPCYAELHTIMVTYLDQPLKDVLQNMFMFRYFGDAATTQRIAIEGGSESTANFVWSSASQAPEAVAELRASFAENLRKFLTRRKPKRVLRAMAEDYEGRLSGG